MNNNVRFITRAGVIAALYLVLTLIAPFTLTFGAVQFRFAEALTLLPVLMPEAVPGLAIGCLIGNLLGGGVWFDVVLGSLATLLAAVCTRKLRSNAWIGAAMPVLFNGIIVGPVVYFAYVLGPDEAVNLGILLSTMGSVALGELVVCYLLGVPLTHVLHRLPSEIINGSNHAQGS